MAINIEFWLIYELLPMAAMVIVPLGVLLHYWRAADARPLPPERAEAATPRGWPDAARAQLRRARVASAIVAVVVLARTLRIDVPDPFEPEWHELLAALLAALLAVFICTAVLLLRPAALGRGLKVQPPTDAEVGGHGHSPTTFGARWWFMAWGACLAALVVAVTWAGLISTPDEHGRYVLHTIRIDNISDGTWVSGSTTIAGWYFGVPIIVAVLLLAALVLIGVSMQTRGPLAPDSDRDLYLRRAATRTLLTLSGGAFVVTLAWVLSSIGGAARMTAGSSQITVSSPLAPIAAPVSVLGMVLEGIGIALLLLPLFSRLPRSTGVSVQDEAAAEQTEQGALRGDARRVG